MKKLALISLLLGATFAIAQVADFPKANFARADSIADLHYGTELDNLPQLAHKLTNNLSSEVDRFRVLHTWVCKNIANDYRLSEHVTYQRAKLVNDSAELAEWNQRVSSRVLSKLLREKKTMCTGYALLLSQLAELAGLECRIVHGYARTATAHVKELGIPNHSWNAVKLDGRWYLCDPTWSSGSLYGLGGVSTFEHDYNEGYFLCPPRYFLQNHYPLPETRRH